MPTEVGEHVVGAYLKLIELCDVVDYNARSPGGGMAGLGEFDVVGLRFTDSTAFVCEVATHLQGLEYGKGYDDSIERIQKKLVRQRQYAEAQLKPFPNRRFMFWSPVVPRGRLVDALHRIEGLEIFVNSEYRAAVNELRERAKATASDTGNPFFRALQILERLRD